ncbi:MAG: pitrilysin family protein [Candidatus Omnitrophica bacterium]|nr:pitrilysin family protein [Candidatus Omnitrophota bacterium]
MYEIININGVTFVFAPFKNLETASFGVFLKIGARYEQSSVKGIAHYLEHLIFKGSKRYSYKEIKREIEGRGGSLNGFTSHEFTGYYAHFLNKNLHPTLDILLDMVFNPVLKNEDIRKERNVILEEIKMYHDLPSSRVVMLLDKLLWPNHPLGEEVIGSFSTVKKINKADLRSFKNNYYLAHNVIIAASGALNKNTISSMIKERIKTKTALGEKDKPCAPAPLKGLFVNVERKKLQQSHLCLGFRSVSYFSPDKFVAELTSIILGANMSSRLFEEIREKKALCYDISTDARKYRDSGAFIIHTGLDKTKIDIALAGIIKELKKIKKISVPAKELTRAKDYLLGQIAMSLERPQGKMFYCAESLLTLEKIYTFEEIKKHVKKIDSGHIRQLAQKTFDFRNMCVACVGDVEANKEKILRKNIETFCA